MLGDAITFKKHATLANIFLSLSFMYCREKVLGKTALIFQDQYVFVLLIALLVPCLPKFKLQRQIWAQTHAMWNTNTSKDIVKL